MVAKSRNKDQKRNELMLNAKLSFFLFLVCVGLCMCEHILILITSLMNICETTQWTKYHPDNVENITKTQKCLPKHVQVNEFPER